jgi:putative transcriptional regulator
LQLGGGIVSKLNLDLIRESRKKHKLSQEEVATRLGYKSLYPYHRKESGQQPFSAEELYELANMYDVPYEYFFKQNVAKNATNQTA